MAIDNQPHKPPDSNAIRNAWDALAAGYDQYVTPTHQQLANTALDLIDMGAGERFLDVAAGSGALGFAAARRGADVLATDISPGMIDTLNENAQRHGIKTVEGRVMDGTDLELADDTFDNTGSMFGVMLFPDMQRGLSEMRRVTQPGGKVLMITFGPPQSVEFLKFFLTAAKHVMPDFVGIPADPPPLPFQASNPATLAHQMERAGLRNVRVEELVETQEFQSAEHLWHWLAYSNPIGARLTNSLPQERAAEVKLTLEHMLRERADGPGPAQLTNAVNVAVATA